MEYYQKHTLYYQKNKNKNKTGIKRTPVGFNTSSFMVSFLPTEENIQMTQSANTDLYAESVIYKAHFLFSFQQCCASFGCHLLPYSEG